MNAPERWEAGSEFHWWLPEMPFTPLPWLPKGELFGSGRDALRMVVLHGITHRKWRRLWIPSYFCPEVVASLLSLGIWIKSYADSPLNLEFVPPSDLRVGDAILVVNFFGLRRQPALIASLQQQQIEVIEDHTHDLGSVWAQHSQADWWVASLRKTLPLPDGGILWSPRGHRIPVPPGVTPERQIASLQKLAGMLLKTMYLLNYPVEKERFHSFLISGEAMIAAGEISGMPSWTQALLATFPVDRWRRVRAANQATLATTLWQIPWVKILEPENPQENCPFSGILLFDTQGRRDFVYQQLLTERIYPAILWRFTSSTPGIRPEDMDFSQRMLSIHCDMRYSTADMLKIADSIRIFGEAYTP